MRWEKPPGTAEGRCSQPHPQAIPVPLVSDRTKLKESSKAGELTEGIIYAVLVKKEGSNSGVTISAKKIHSYFPPAYTKSQIEEVIYSLLEEWKQNYGEGEREDAESTV